jgi:hypothetical protein
MIEMPSEVLQALVAVLVAILGWNVRRLSTQLDTMQRRLEVNTGRLIRIETKLGIPDTNHDTA